MLSTKTCGLQLKWAFKWNKKVGFMYLHRGKKSLKINMFPIEEFRGKNSNEEKLKEWKNIMT